MPDLMIFLTALYDFKETRRLIYGKDRPQRRSGKSLTVQALKSEPTLNDSVFFL